MGLGGLIGSMMTGGLGNQLGLTDFLQNNAGGGNLGFLPKMLAPVGEDLMGKPKPTPKLNQGLDPLGFLRALGYIQG